MGMENRNDIIFDSKKKIWKEPTIQIIDVRDTASGYDPAENEDTADMQATLS